MAFVRLVLQLTLHHYFLHSLLLKGKFGRVFDHQLACDLPSVTYFSLTPWQLTLCFRFIFFPVLATMDKEDEELPQGPPVQDTRTLVATLTRELAQVDLADFSGSSSVESSSPNLIDRGGRGDPCYGMFTKFD